MITLELVTLSGVKYDQDVHEVILPTVDGHIGVFGNHAPLVSIIVPGVISIRNKPGDADSKIEQVAISGGAVEINGKRIRVLVDEATHSDEVNREEAVNALKRAKELAKEAKDKVTFDKAQNLIQTAQSKLRIAEIKKRRHR